jgi:hypothetical protein
VFWFDGSARRGVRRVADRSHPSSQTVAVDLQLGKFRLFVAGYAFDGATGLDFLIRGYDIRFDVTTPD